MSRLPEFWVVIPAAGSAQRMNAPIPKQYLPLAGRTVIEHAVRPFLALPQCRGMIVALAKEDDRWRSLSLSREPRIRCVVGGRERRDSVHSALAALPAQAQDWVLVHDAARPCLSDADLRTLLTTLRDDPVGGLLATPVVDTLKRDAGDGRVQETVERTGLWHALTPQMFRYATLRQALEGCSEATDESQAVERLGLAPKLVAGSAENLKITLPADLMRAERILSSREPQ